MKDFLEFIAMLYRVAKKMGMQMDRALDPQMDKIHRFLCKVKGSRRYALNIISGISQGHSHSGY